MLRDNELLRMKVQNTFLRFVPDLEISIVFGTCTPAFYQLNCNYFSAELVSVHAKNRTAKIARQSCQNFGWHKEVCFSFLLFETTSFPYLLPMGGRHSLWFHRPTIICDSLFFFKILERKFAREAQRERKCLCLCLLRNV